MLDHKFKKKYGQNFLMDKNILNKICESICPNKNDLIIEIGPGSGNLTKRLKEISIIHGIKLIDHIIMGNDSYFSFFDNNMI